MRRAVRAWNPSSNRWWQRSDRSNSPSGAARTRRKIRSTRRWRPPGRFDPLKAKGKGKRRKAKGERRRLLVCSSTLSQALSLSLSLSLSVSLSLFDDDDDDGSLLRFSDALQRFPERIVLSPQKSFLAEAIPGEEGGRGRGEERDGGKERASCKNEGSSTFFSFGEGWPDPFSTDSPPSLRTVAAPNAKFPYYRDRSVTFSLALGFFLLFLFSFSLVLSLPLHLVRR